MHSQALGVRAAAYALKQLGRPYVWGGAGPRVFDCSGLVTWAYGHAGRHGLGHWTGWLKDSGPHIRRNRLQTGDLVFFYGTEHVGIYLFADFFIHAPHTGDVVKISRLSGHYDKVWAGAVRIQQNERGGVAENVRGSLAPVRPQKLQKRLGCGPDHAGVCLQRDVHKLVVNARKLAGSAIDRAKRPAAQRRRKPRLPSKKLSKALSSERVSFRR